ncbi:MAG TPA: HEAT repeat domain-containing protein [Gemmatimonadaceae bacterium]|nr:HEAT repeat domain-containing protein [Gemmatimonadaceae bacterium]
MKCLTILMCIAVASAPPRFASSQATPPASPTPPAQPTTPRPARAPRAATSAEWRYQIDARLDQERQSELQELQAERQAELQDRQRELEERQADRMAEQERRMQERMFERDLTSPRATTFQFVEPAAAPVSPLAPLAWSDQARVPESLDGAFLNRRPPAAWAQGDPADSLYRVARESLNRGDYRRAAQLFNDLTRRYPSSSYAYVSSYYEAFSRYRIGTTEELMAADRALRAIADRSAPTGNGWRDNTDVDGLRTRIRGALAMRGNDGAAVEVEKKARDAGTSCDQEDLMVRVEALNALSQMDAAAALPILKRVLERKEDCLVELRRRAIFMLARRADSEATSLLIWSAKNDPNVTVRSEAISYLPRMPGDAGAAALEDILRTSDDERIQRTAVRALMSSESPRVRSSLRGLLERRDASETLQLQVLEAYSKERSTPDDAAYLRQLYNRSDSERMKMAIVSALARIGGKDNQDWLAGLVRNTSESSQMRYAALQRLSRSDLPVSEIDRLYDASDSRPMREQLISALGSRKEPEATDKLIEIAKNSTDLDMRRLAINYLSRKNDPRATKLLMELIEK